MAPKQPKAQGAEEPAAKKAKADEEPKKEEEPKFQEPDAPNDNRPAMTGKIGFATADTTLNVIPTVGGQLLTCLSEGGMALLLAGARAGVGQKSGRYMFEAKIVQTTGKANLRIGFSTSESSLVLGEDASSVYFDSEGVFCADKKKSNMKGRCDIRKDQVVAVVLNLDSKSPNANTVALYRDGALMGDVMPLPESLKGKTLFPHLAYRNASVRVNFGPSALKELPFKSRMLGAAAASDVAVAASKEPKDGKYEVVMPVAFPDEGTFDWVDGFMEKNPQFVELSDRKIAQWVKASGHWSKGDRGGNNGSNDRPSLSTGIRELDDLSVRKVINAVAPIMPRHYLIMEVKSNLIAIERKEALKKFSYPCYKKVARVIMGEPGKEWKTQVQNKLLKEKQTRSDRIHEAKKTDAARKKQAAERAKEVAKARKEAEKKRKAAAEEKAAEKKKKEAEEKAAKEDGEKKEEETKEEPKEEEKKEEPKEEEEEKEVAEEPELGEAPTVELTDEEKKKYFLPRATPDLAPQVMAASYGRFTTPEADEGFDDIVFEWQKEAKAAAYLKDWVLNKKLTTRIEDIKPGKVFREKVAEFEKLCKQWKDKLTAFKAGGAKKPAKKADEDADDIDIFSVTDACDVGGGVPLFENFTFEDFELMKLRFQLCLLVLSFKVDCNDADRAGIPMDHLGFYYNKYYGKTFSTKPYGVADVKDVIAMIKDVVGTKDGLLVSQLADDLENLDIFLKLTEEGRRERQRRLDAGDESARLKFVQPVEPKPAAPKPAPAAAKPVTVAANPAMANVVAASGTTSAASKMAEIKANSPVAAKGAGKDQGKKGGKDQGKAWGKGKW